MIPSLTTGLILQSFYARVKLAGESTAQTLAIREKGLQKGSGTLEGDLWQAFFTEQPVR